MKDVNYVIGRLQGLNELVKILKDLVDKKGNENSETIAVVTDHVAAQLNSILIDLDKLDVEPQHREALSQIKEKHSEPLFERRPIRDQSTVHDDSNKDSEDEESEDSEESADQAPAEQLEKHEKTVDDLLRDLESMKN
jgi:hypothetical protein